MLCHNKLNQGFNIAAFSRFKFLLANKNQMLSSEQHILYPY